MENTAEMHFPLSLKFQKLVDNCFSIFCFSLSDINCCRICIAINYKMASCAEYRVVAGKFGVSTTTVHTFILQCYIGKKREFIV